MIPIENSLAGRVADIHHLLPTSGLHIVGEHFLPIHFQLMAPKGATLKDIRTVHSHIHALGQCRKIIRKHGWKAVVAGDTAGAAREVAEAGDRTRGGARPAPRRRDLRPRHPRGERRGRGPQHHALHRPVEEGRARARPSNGPVITTFVFRVRNVPAALYKAMGGFATNGVNMTKLESYQLDGAVHRDAVLRRRRGPPRRPPAEAGAGGTGLLLRPRSGSSASTRRASSGRDWGRMAAIR